MSDILNRIGWCFGLLFCLWLVGLFLFIDRIPEKPSPDIAKADVIVVLTGGSGRLEYGLQLFAVGYGKRVFISGAGKDVTLPALLDQLSPNLRTQIDVSLQANIILGHEAENTIGNAEETIRWLKPEHPLTLIIVTANYHMPRSLNEFKAVMPKYVKIIPAPVIPDDFAIEGWWRTQEQCQLMFSEYHKFLASKLRHLIVSVTEDI